MTNLLTFLDTETGGLDSSNTSLLSLGFGVLNVDTGLVLGTKELFVRHSPYQVDAGALNVNKIDLVKHHEKAYTPLQVIDMIQDFLYPYYKTEPAVLAGHNIPFDVDFTKTLFTKFGKADLFKSLFSHRTVDTLTIARFLNDTGKIAPTRCSGSALFKHFGIVNTEEHTALADCVATIELYKHLCKAVA